MASIVYVTKSRIVTPKGEILPDQVLRGESAFTRIGIPVDQIQSMEKGGHLIMCSEAQLIDVLRGRPIKPPVPLGNTKGLDGRGDGEFSEKENIPYENTTNDPQGWDPKFLDAKDLNELRNIAKQALPALEGTEHMERNKLIDILSFKHKSRVNNFGS